MTEDSRDEGGARPSLPIRPARIPPPRDARSNSEETTSLIWVPPFFEDELKRMAGAVRFGSGFRPRKLRSVPQTSFESRSSSLPAGDASVDPYRPTVTSKNLVKIALVALVFLLVVALLAFLAGRSGRKTVPIKTTSFRPEVTAQDMLLLDRAMAELRGEKGIEALEKLKELDAATPGLPSLNYVIALAALQAGDIALASAAADASIAKGERVSDAYALKAAAENLKPAMPGWQSLGDAAVNAESYLRQAVQADPANPNALVELAMMLRGQGKKEEARKMLEGARLRMNPVDSLTVVNTTLLLMQLQDLPDEKLPGKLDPDKDSASLFGAAYVSMRFGNYASAAQLLEKGRQRMAPGLFLYLLQDPVLAEYAARPELERLFR